MTDNRAFPKFYCMISKKDEDFDSDVEAYFIEQNNLLSTVATLIHKDPEWRDTYVDIVKYIRELEDSIINLREPPSYKFLVDLSSGEEDLDNDFDRLLRAPNAVSALAFQASVLVSKVAYWFVKLSKQPLYSSSFTIERYEGLPFLKLVLSHRSVALSKVKV